MAVATAEREYQFLKRFLRNRMGYDLGDDKSYLVESRLNPLAAAYQLASWQELVHSIEASPRGDVICDAMTTNETSFFRDKSPFETLKQKLIPDLIDRRERSRSLKIWCGASSTGQEPVSVIITIYEHFPELLNWNLKFLATDISRSALDRARSGTYSQFEVQRGMPIQLLIKYFRQSGDLWNMSEDIKRVVQYRKFNLMDSFAGLGGPFDLIFLRNVLIYFYAPTKSQIFSKLRTVAADDGILALGGSESVFGLTESFKSLPGTPGFYQPS